MKRFFFDADGVLFLYEREAYVGEDPIWLRKNQHYFRNLTPDKKMLEVVDMLSAKARYTDDEIYILTSLSNNGIIFNEHFHDKIVSFHKWFPYIDIDHILISTGPKRDVVEYVTNNPITENDILIDDFNRNLVEWRNSGGISIKYCNGINDPASFDGKKLLSQTQSPDDMLRYLLNL